MKDIVPELLEKIQAEFEEKISRNLRILLSIDSIKKGTATYEKANKFAEELGDILAEVLKNNINADMLPDGKMYYNIADRVINTTLKRNYELVADYARDVQTILNKKAGLSLKGIKPEFNTDKAKGIINRLATEELFSDVEWILQEPIVNFTQSVIDDSVKANADFHHKLGLRPSIERISTGKCCEWCDRLAGTYNYPDTPKDVFRRHRFCRCTVEYDPATGKRQNVHTKKWIDPKRNHKIEKRKILSESELSNKNLNKDTRIDRNKIFSPEYDRKIQNLGENKRTTKSIKETAKVFLRHRDGTHFEDLAFIDSQSGKFILSTGYEVEHASKPTRRMLEFLKAKDDFTIIGIHNHPNSTFPSGEDLYVCAKRKYKYGLIIAHDGRIIKYETINEFDELDGINYNVQLDKFNRKMYNESEYIELIAKVFGVKIEVLGWK